MIGAKMKPYKLGKMELHRIEEMHFTEDNPFDHFLDLPEDAVSSNLEWLEKYMDMTVEPPCIKTSVHTWALKTDKHTVLVDTCIGNDKERPYWGGLGHMNLPWLENLADEGIQPEDVDYVVITHLHLDHVGWNTKLVDGKWVPTFPNAKYIIPKKDYEFRKYTNALDLSTGEVGEEFVFDDSIVPVVEAGQAVFADDGFKLDLGDMEIVVELAEGHAFGNTIVKITSEGETIIFVGDIIHHPIQVAYPDSSGIHCIFPPEANETRRRVLEESARYHYLIGYAHATEPYVTYVKKTGEGQYAIVEPEVELIYE